MSFLYVIGCVLFLVFFVYVLAIVLYFFFFFFKQKTAYEMRISDWSSDVCSSDLKLGHGLEVSAIGIGCMPMIKGGNILYGEAADVDESTRTIHRAIDLGVTFFDTAQIYGPFSNEELLGQAIKGKRDGLVIATKFGFRFDGKQKQGRDNDGT